MPLPARVGCTWYSNRLRMLATKKPVRQKRPVKSLKKKLLKQFFSQSTYKPFISPKNFSLLFRSTNFPTVIAFAPQLNSTNLPLPVSPSSLPLPEIEVTSEFLFYQSGFKLKQYFLLSQNNLLKISRM